jgi:multimeric flavodoxin WrbA
VRADADTHAAENAPPQVLCIAGSPRRHGNSEQLLDALMRGVESAGGLAAKLVAVAAGAQPCRGCNACSETGRCVQRDGMDAVYSRLDEADAIAVATPVFFATVPAVLKIIFDRCQPYWARRHVLGEPAPTHKRPGAVLVVGGGGDPFGTGCAITAVKSVFAVLGVSAENVFECVGPDGARDIQNHPEALERAEQIGAELVAQILDQRA